jgi:hypothetical protein
MEMEHSSVLNGAQSINEWHMRSSVESPPKTQRPTPAKRVRFIEPPDTFSHHDKSEQSGSGNDEEESSGSAAPLPETRRLTRSNINRFVVARGMKKGKMRVVCIFKARNKQPSSSTSHQLDVPTAKKISRPIKIIGKKFVNGPPNSRRLVIAGKGNKIKGKLVEQQIKAKRFVPCRRSCRRTGKPVVYFAKVKRGINSDGSDDEDKSLANPMSLVYRPIMPEAPGFFDKLFQTAPINVTANVLQLQKQWRKINKSINIVGDYIINGETKTAVFRGGILTYLANVSEEWYNAHSPEPGKPYYRSMSYVVKKIPPFFRDHPGHTLIIELTTRDHMCALFIKKTGNVYEFMSYDPNLGNISQPLMNMVMQIARRTPLISTWAARANRAEVCVGLTWAFLTHVMLNAYDPYINERIRGQKTLPDFKTVQMDHDANDGKLSSIGYVMDTEQRANFVIFSHE